MRNDSRFIPGEEIAVVSQWNFGAVDTASLKLAAEAKSQQQARDEIRDEELRQQGYAEGFAQGHAHALVHAEEQIHAFTTQQGQEAAGRLTALLGDAERQLAEAQQVMSRGVLELACELARQVLRHELSVNPNALQPVIREALDLLAGDGKPGVLRLNPVDMDMLQDFLKDEFAGRALTLVSDASIRPGGCLLASAGTVVDGSLDTRWRRAVANIGLNPPWEHD